MIVWVKSCVEFNKYLRKNLGGCNEYNKILEDTIKSFLIVVVRV